MSGGAPGLSVVLPTLDEGGGLKVLLPRLKAVFASLGVSGEILVVDGGSKDDTVEVARSHGARVMRQKGKGFGSALREGLHEARAEWVAVMDADVSHAPEDLVRFWARRGDAELIVGSRYCRGGSAEMPLTRQILSRSLNMVSRRVLDLPVRESSSGFRLYHGPSVRAVRSDATDFSVQQDLLVGILAGGGRVIELPIHYAPRVAGASKANAWKLAPAYVRLLLRLKPLRGGWKAEAGLFAALAVGLLTGLTGITGGLPGPGRLRALPEALRGSPEFAAKLADSWRALYAGIERAHAELAPDEPRTSVAGVADVPPGWTYPPDALINSARSLLTQSVNPDEKKSFIILSRMRPWRLEFEPLYAQYGGAFIYPLGAFLAAAHVLHLARLTPDLAYYLANPGAMARLYLLGRLYALLFHLGALWMLYELGRVLSGRRTGTAAALLWALAPVAVVNAHVLKPHPVAAFWFAAAAYCLVRAVEEGRWTDYLLCGLGAGLAAGGNLAAGYALGMPVLARLARREGSWGPALAGAAAGLGVVALTNPYLVFAPRHFAWELTIYSPAHFGVAREGILAFASKVLPAGLGLGLAAAAALGAVRGLFADARRRALAVLLIGGGILVFARFPSFASSVGSLRLHYAALGLAVVVAADFLASLPRPFPVLLLAAVLAETGLRGAVYLENLRREAGPGATRQAAAEWMDANIPAGASVGLADYPAPAHTPPFRWDRLRLKVYQDPAAAAADGPEWFAGSETDLAVLERAAPNRYDTARRFPSAELLGLRAVDDAFFANSDMIILHRRPDAR